MDSFLDTLKQLGPARLGIMGSMVVGLLMFFVFVSLRVSTPDMKLLYADLSSTDSGAIAAKLEKSEIAYKISPDGARIIVPEPDIGRARILLAEAGLPNGGSLGYEIFDEQTGFGTTNFVQNINQVRALEGELARTISSMNSIRSARVHLVLPQRELFSRETRASSAAVSLGLRPGAKLNREHILAIQSLVSSAVPNLKISNVSIIDGNGNLLARGDKNETSLLSVKAEEMRLNYENQLTNKIKDQVGRIVGFGNVSATVTAEINFDHIVTNEEIFDPEMQVVRSSQVTEENNLEREGSPRDVSVENNLPGIGSDILTDNKPSAESNRIEEVTNFEISKTLRNTVREVGEIKRLSIAVSINGRYITDEEGNKTYESRSDAEMQQITALVRSIVGFSEDREDLIEVANLQFIKIDTDEEFINERMLFGFEKSQLLEVAEIITIAIMVVLVVLLVLQPMVNKILAMPSLNADEGLEADLLAASPIGPALAAPENDFMHTDEEVESLINVQGVEGKVKASSIKKVEEIVESYPNEAVAVLRSWMTQES